MTPDEIRAFFDGQQAHWRDRDGAALAEGHAPDGTIVSPIFRTVTGSRAIAVSYTTLFDIFPDWDLQAEELLIDGNRVAQPFSVTATHRGEFMGLAGTGKPFSIQGVRLFTMRDGRIAHERRYYDFTGLLLQIGILKTKPGY
ncbi:MAG TPA: ester cyclase [Vicinamibacterales bacterium]|nr:ester cyclase [Vicinamibacterales bacterium]